MASSVELEWYRDGSGVPVGWKEGAVALRVVALVPLVPLAWLVEGSVAIGAIVAVLLWSLMRVRISLSINNLESRVMVCNGRSR